MREGQMMLAYGARAGKNITRTSMTIQELLQRAVPLHQAGRLDEAKTLYDQVLAIEPANYAALHLMGLLRLQQARVHEALVLMEAALKVKPGAPETLSNYAM